MSTWEAGAVGVSPAPPLPPGGGGGAGSEAPLPSVAWMSTLSPTPLAIAGSFETKKKPQETTSKYCISLFLSTIRLGYHREHILSILNPVASNEELLDPEFPTTPRELRIRVRT